MARRCRQRLDVELVMLRPLQAPQQKPELGGGGLQHRRDMNVERPEADAERPQRRALLLGEPDADTGEGNPPHLIKLADGRLCLTYGHRAKPFGIYARLSKDGGKTWSLPIVLRADGGGRAAG